MAAAAISTTITESYIYGNKTRTCHYSEIRTRATKSKQEIRRPRTITRRSLSSLLPKRRTWLRRCVQLEPTGEANASEYPGVAELNDDQRISIILADHFPAIEKRLRRITSNC
jgi:hypothetical protein